MGTSDSDDDCGGDDEYNTGWVSELRRSAKVGTGSGVDALR